MNFLDSMNILINLSLLNLKNYKKLYMQKLMLSINHILDPYSEKFNQIFIFSCLSHGSSSAKIKSKFINFNV